MTLGVGDRGNLLSGFGRSLRFLFLYGLFVIGEAGVSRRAYSIVVEIGMDSVLLSLSRETKNKERYKKISEA